MVTIKDVAREAKMSVATVSRVLNASGPVSNETQRLIREVARRMRYVPHSGARSLITSRTETLGVLLPDLEGLRRQARHRDRDTGDARARRRRRRDVSRSRRRVAAESAEHHSGRVV